MPSFDIVIPDSFLFIPANLSFISFCIFTSFILSKILRSSIMFFVILISLLSIAYYDFFVKFIIKNYYELTQMDSKIYAKAHKNADKKIESLSLLGVYVYALKYSRNLTASEEYQISKVHESYVEKFIDISTFGTKFNRYNYGNQRVYLNGYTSKEKEEPRYIISKKLKESFFPSVFENYEYRFLDKKTGIIIATAFKISFIKNNNKFRNNYLYWSVEKEEDFNLSSVQNFDRVYKKVFIDD